MWRARFATTILVELIANVFHFDSAIFGTDRKTTEGKSNNYRIEAECKVVEEISWNVAMLSSAINFVTFIIQDWLDERSLEIIDEIYYLGKMCKIEIIV